MAGVALVCVTALLLAAGSVRAAPSDVGEWSAPLSWPLVAVHMSLEPDGQVLAFDGFSYAPNSERLWNPSTGAFTSVPYSRNLFCAGHTQLPDGRTLIVGGHVSANAGLADTTIFNPVTKLWTRGPDMAVTRWYPTALQLPNGRVFVYAGDNIVVDRPGQPHAFEDASVDSLPEVYDPAGNTWQSLTGAKLTSPLYPYLFMLTDGRILDAGPDTVTRTISPGIWSWQTVGTSGFDGGSAVMYRPNKVMKSGSWSDPDFAGAKQFDSTNRTAVLDMNAANPTWRETAPMNFGRAYHTLTVLPDGKVLATGGQSTSDGIKLQDAVLPAEIWDPATETWTTVAPLANGRLYHSTALLLKDGRVLVAGGGRTGPEDAVNQLSAEVYSPPYLFKAPRPTISSAPASVNVGSNFTVSTPNAASIQRVSFVRTSSVTHAFNMSQRYLELPFTAGSGSLTVQAPPNANHAPPGDYLLFLVDSNGVPSVGEVVRVNQAAVDPTGPTVSITAPSAGASLSSTTTVTASASDAVGIGGVQFRLDGSDLGPEDVTAPYSVSWDTTTATSGPHTLTAIARDLSGNVTTSSAVAITVDNGPPPPPPGLVAAYGFDAGSGTSAADSSGLGNGGTISGPTWTTAGKYGQALTFDGVNDQVSVPDAASLDLTTGMTLEAWVRPTVLGSSWRTVLMKEQAAYYAYALYAGTGTGVPSGNGFIGGSDVDVRAPAALALNTWTHLAATYDGAALRVYVNGTQVAQQLTTGGIVTSTGVLRIGGNNVWSEWFEGQIDEVRVYNRALTPAELQGDMSRPVTNPDSTPPSAPGTLSAGGGLGTALLSWGAASDNTGVARYNVHRGTSAGFTPSLANRVAQPTGTGYTDTGLAPGTYYYKVTAEDGAGNVGPPSNEASATVTGDTTPPTVSITAPMGGTVTGTISVDATATDNGSVAGVQFRLDGASLGAEDTAAPYSTSWATTTATNGAHTLTAVARDAAGNTTTSSSVSVTVSNTAPTGLVAAYGFDAGSGATVADQSGNGNGGTINGPTWTTSGRYGSALVFDGVNDWVTVPDSASLDATTGVTVEAWVYPTSSGNWRTIAFKEQAGNLVYGLYSNRTGNRPNAQVFVAGADRNLDGTTALPQNAWSHLAMTYDGATIRLFVNAAQVAQVAQTGAIATSTGVLRIGGNNIWSEWFGGRVDELRVYNRALTAAQLQTDMTTPLTNPDSAPPSVPGTLTGTVGLTSVSLSWGAATDNVAVLRYNVHRGASAGFAPTAANRIAQPTGTTYNDTALPPGTYYYKVTAEDAAGNVGATSNELIAAVTGDVTPPGAPGTLTATGGLSSVGLSWGAAADNVGVVRYNVHRGTSAGFTPTAGNRIAQPTGMSYSDTGLSPGTYYYKVTAEDAAGNVGASSNEASGVLTGDVTPPGPPGTLSATGGLSSATLSWGAATDNVGVARYNVHRSTTAGFTPSAANRIAQPTGTGYTDATLTPGTYYYRVTAEDAVGNVGSPTNEANAVVTGDTTGPTVAITSPSGGSTVSGTVSVDASASDNLGVVGVQFRLDGAALGAEDTAAPYAVPWNTATAADGPHALTAVARDAAGNTTTSSTTTVIVNNSATPGLVAAYGFDAGAGTTVADQSGNGNSGTIAGPTWTTAGRFGSALQFDGVDDLVTVADSASLDLTGGMTLEAWVRPTALSSWNTVVLKERPGYYAYALYANTGTSRPSGNVFTTSDFDVRGSAAVAANAWTHLAATYNGSSLVLYVNGTQAATLAATGAIATSTAVLRIGGNSIWGEYFQGLIDEVRVYNRALTPAQIQSDQNRPITNPDTTLPSAPGTLAATGGISSIGLTWGAATDNVGVVRYNVHRSTTAGFTPSAANRIGQPTTPSYTDSPLTAGTYYYRVTAEDAAGNVGPVSNEASAVVTGDVSAPTAPGTLSATGGLGSVTLSWGAASDNVAVTRYNVHRGASAGFTPTAGNRIAQPSGTSYTDTPLSPGTYYYRVTAEDAAGNVGAASNEANAVVTGDTQPPTVSITAPSAGAAVAGTVSVSANASDNGTVAGVQFRVDGANIGGEDTSAPYTVNWDTTASANGTHGLTAVARDGAGNTTTSSTVPITVNNVAPTGLVAAYGFDEGAGATVSDASGNGNTGTISGATWTIGRSGNALLFDGVNDWLTIADSASLDVTSGVSLEAWVYPTALGTAWRTVLFKEQSGDLVYGLYANRNTTRPNGQVYVGGTARELDGTASLSLNTWSHLAMTYDGSTIRLFLNGTQVSQVARTGAVATSTGALRIGGNNVWPEWFAGRIDDVRVYNRALTTAQVQADMNQSAAPDSTAPTVASTLPASGASNVLIGANVTARFSEAMNSATIGTASFELRDASGTLVPAAVSYDSLSATATLAPSVALLYGATYTAILKGGSGGVKDVVGNALGANYSWSFTAEPPPPPILVLGAASNPFSSYATEILAAEGLNAFRQADIATVTAPFLDYFDVIVLGDIPLNAAQTSMLTDWVQAGGNLVALRPSPLLASLLGLTSTGTTLQNGYLRVDTAAGPGAGIVADTMQFHGAADGYALNGATAVATLYSSASTATTNPAVSLRSVGNLGGQAAAFTFDLARSVVYTRQGNPAWAGQDRDGIVPVRPNDLFYGARTGDVQPDWLDTNKIAIPQADEQQRLLANLIETMTADRGPVPRFWYFPRDLKAVVVMTGDDHAQGGTAGRFDRYVSLSPPGCVVANWECIRGTSYIYPNSPLTNTQAATYAGLGFEVALHVNAGSPCFSANWTPASLAAAFVGDLADFASKYTSIPSPVTERTHCVAWTDWATHAQTDRANGIKLDTNYYHYPDTWIGAKPGFLTGSGMFMRFAALDGSTIDVYQAHTNMTDESGQQYPATPDALLDRALGGEGYYGMFVVNAHTDQATSAVSEAVIASAQARGVPVISAKQALDWVVARNASSFRAFSWDGSQLGFEVVAAPGSNGLRALLPLRAGAKTLTSLTRGGAPVSFTTTTLKGVEYAVFPGLSGNYVATYS
jgi:fibronectin type 3 domain-containing protein